MAWGNGQFGKTNVPAYLTNVLSVAGGYDHSVALRTDGTVVVWGSPGYGATNVPEAATNVVAIASRDFHTLALRADGTVIAWGGTDAGVTNVPTYLRNVARIAAGSFHSVALMRAHDFRPFITQTRGGNSIHFNLPSELNRTYTLERSESLSPPAWSTSRVLTGNGMHLRFNTNVAASAQFFRVRVD